MSYNDSGVYRNPVPPSGYGAQPVVYEQAGGMNLPGMQQGYGGRQSNSFFHKMGLNDYYDTPPHSGREERADDSPSSSDDDDDEDNGIFDGVLGKIFGGGGNQQQYQQQQDQGGISGAISGLIGKVTGHGGSSQGGMGMGMGQIDPAWAMQQRQSIYGGGIRSGAANFGLDAIAAAAGAEAMRMFSSRGGGQGQDPGLAQKTLAGLAVAEAGRMVKRYFEDAQPARDVQAPDEGAGGGNGRADLARHVPAGQHGRHGRRDADAVVRRRPGLRRQHGRAAAGVREGLLEHTGHSCQLDPSFLFISTTMRPTRLLLKRSGFGPKRIVETSQSSRPASQLPCRIFRRAFAA